MIRRAAVLAGLVGIALLAVNWPAAALPDGMTADRVVVDKSERRMWLYSGFQR